MFVLFECGVLGLGFLSSLPLQLTYLVCHDHNTTHPYPSVAAWAHCNSRFFSSAADTSTGDMARPSSPDFVYQRSVGEGGREGGREGERDRGGGGRGGRGGRKKGRKREGDERMGGREKERILYSIHILYVNRSVMYRPGSEG